MLDLFSKLEADNLALIQECQEVDRYLQGICFCNIQDVQWQAEARLAAGKAVSIKTRSELNQQAENLEAEIRQLEDKISSEKREAAKIEEVIENSGEIDNGELHY